MSVSARQLFAPLGPTYDRYASLLSFGQDPALAPLSRLADRRLAPADRVLDVATGTAAVAIELARRHGCSVVGLDQSPEMLAEGRARVERAGLAGRIELVEGRAEELPFEDGSFDALTFTYLLRYVEDPAATLAELARVVRPGGTIASLEFGVPPGRLAARRLEPLRRASAFRSPAGSSRRAGTRSAASSGRASAASTSASRSRLCSTSGARPESRTFAIGASASAAAIVIWGRRA